MRTAPRWTSADLEVLPDDGKRYEIIDGELYMSRQPHWHHQRACVKICGSLVFSGVKNYCIISYLCQQIDVPIS